MKDKFWVILSIFLAFISGISSSSYQYCCQYCRGDPNTWIKSVSTFRLNPDNDVTRMFSPPAYMVNDKLDRPFQVEKRNYAFRYGGAPMRIKHQSLSLSADILNEQYIQFDLALPKAINGILTQGGFYEETAQNLIPRKESWITRYIVSYSNDSAALFEYLKDERGNIQVLTGPNDYSFPTLESFAEPPVARYLRFHPLEGRTAEGVATDVSVRVTPVTCERKPCVTPKINCLMSPWSDWSQCECQGGPCTQSRDRRLLRLQACGGATCGDTTEKQGCTPSQPAWVPIVQYLGIGLLIVLVIVVAAVLIVKNRGRDRVEVIAVREMDDDDYDDEEATPGGKAGEAGMYPPFAGPQFMPPPFMASSFGAPPPSYSERPTYAGVGKMGGVTPLDNENTFME